MYGKCEHCGEFAVDDSENIEVCKSCGIVIEDTTFSTTEFVPVTNKTFTPYTKSESRLHKQKRKPLSLQHGQTVLDNLCHINNISLVHKNEINELFKLVVSEKHFTRKEDAGAAVAGCVFLLMRKHRQTIPINTLCKQVPCTKKKFSLFLKFIKSCLSSNEKFKQHSFSFDNHSTEGQKEEEEGVPNIVPCLIREICEKAETQMKTQLMEKTNSLVKLAYSCWLFTGRCPRSVVVACAFLCWKSMHLPAKNFNFKNFCELLEIREPSAHLRIPELKALLVKLGKMLPSRSENYVNKRNLLFHLNTILEYSETLRHDLFPDSHTSAEVDMVEFSTFRIPPQKRSSRKEPADTVHYDTDMNASDIEICESEIETYLAPNKKKIIEFVNKLTTINKFQH